MSAQIITALRRRADALEQHAQSMTEAGHTDEADLTLEDGTYVYGRDVRFMMLMATEFRLLANEAEEVNRDSGDSTKHGGTGEV